MLGVDLQTLSDCVFSPYDETHLMSAIDKLENFVSVLYSRLLQSLTCLINRLVSVTFCDFKFLYLSCFLSLTKLLLSVTVS